MHLQKNIVSQPHNDASAHSEHLFVIFSTSVQKRKEKKELKAKKREECLSSSGIKYELMEWSLDMVVATKKTLIQFMLLARRYIWT